MLLRLLRTIWIFSTLFIAGHWKVFQVFPLKVNKFTVNKQGYISAHKQCIHISINSDINKCIMGIPISRWRVEISTFFLKIINIFSLYALLFSLWQTDRKKNQGCFLNHLVICNLWLCSIAARLSTIYLKRIVCVNDSMCFR